MMLGLSERLTLGWREGGYDGLVLGLRVDGIRVGESMLGILVAGLEGLTLESEELEGFVDGMMIIMLDAAIVGIEVV